MTTPALTVLMPVYNAEQHLAEALESILSQSFTDFEFLIVDDGSTDASLSILEEYARRDKRIRILRNDSNQGIAVSLNRGFAEARAELVARMDADDISMPGRLARQVAFMAAHPDIAVSSGHMRIYETGMVHRYPLADAPIRAFMLWGSPLCHAATTIRKHIWAVAGGYQAERVPAEDLDFWFRIAALPNVRFANQDEIFYIYRIYPEKNRESYHARQRMQSLTVFREYLLTLGMDEADLDMDAHAALCGYPVTPAIVHERIAAWRRKLEELNKRVALCEPALFARLCADRLYAGAVRAKWAPFWLKRRIPPSVTRKIKKIVYALKILREKPAPTERNAPLPPFFPRDVPVFIISFNRLTYLKKLVVWLEKNGFANITIVDNGSTYSPLLAYLDSLPHRVVRLAENLGHLTVWKCGLFEETLSQKYYIVTDPDVVPDEACPGDAVMRFYNRLVEFPRITKCGFGLRIDDLPEAYPLRDSVMTVEKPYWTNPLPDGAGYFAPIDTTFALYRPGIGPDAPHWLEGVRLAPPYVARHLPWYEIPDAMDAEALFYRESTLTQSTFWTAVDADSLKKENLALRTRIGELEQQVEILSRGLGNQIILLFYKILRSMKKKILDKY